jgi:hypothetical protein
MANKKQEKPTASKKEAPKANSNDKAGTSDGKEKKPPTLLERKELPSVAYLLAHGDPETAHLPKTWCEIVGYPVALALVFAISLLTFHHAPHHLAPPMKPHVLPTMNRLPLFEKQNVMETNMPPVPPENDPPKKESEL